MTNLLKHSELITALRGNAALMAKITKLADSVADAQPTPYIVVGQTTENCLQTTDNTTNEITTIFHVWSTYNGRKEVLEIRDLFKAALPEWCYYNGTEILKDSDEPTYWHGIISISYIDN